ncbi:hypothetical protein KC343_g10862 [Hortaea werneckii]|nr:hypothetical protein KC317_g1644 [Hortaea werneckii]KAI7607385.1 hypothetical protein KC346_g10097 [Hortaea werneckii]KAI7613485.1 hypothetical protein KC343_g10862 [Hortaea werneckii]KAI7651108.1 hypothetical protein KC319_g10928 [Hortaea werneckii]KAI7693534.1 hypothetical protein KC322_g10707 [Hortaea werneckii]
MPVLNLSCSLLPNSPCPPSILIRGITPKSSSSSSSPDGNTSGPLLEFSPILTTIPLHLWTNLPWVPSPISALLGTPIQLARYPAAAASTTGVNTTTRNKPSPYSSPSSGAKASSTGTVQNKDGVQQTEEVDEAEEDEDGDFQPIAPLLPFFLETDPDDVATFGKVRLNALQGTVIVSSSTTLDPPATTTTTTTSSSSSNPAGATSSKDAADPAKEETTETLSSSTQSPNHRPPPPPPPPLTPRLLAQMTQYLNGPVFRAIQSYRQLDPLSTERRLRAREIRTEMFSPQAFERWVLRGGSEGDGERELGGAV